MKKLYFLIFLVLLIFTIAPLISKGQDCSHLTATFKPYESRCAATGSIKVFASGGSGSYKYKTVGPVNSNFTTSDSITGLSAGTYLVVVTDIVSNCTFNQSGIVVDGTYNDPRFTLTKTDVSCDNQNNGSIQVSGQQFGRAPFLYSIIAPSTTGIGTSNSNGFFDNLAPGNYTVRMTDSCGGVQTRQITMNGYSWYIDAFNFNKTGCDSATGYIKVIDSKGNISTVSGIPGFSYGIVREPGDTVWSTNPSFIFNLKGRNTFTVVVKDNCGEVKKKDASLIIIPVIGTIVISKKKCNSFIATVIGTTNFFNPNYCLFDNSNTLISCNTTGIFTNLAYGSYCINAHDSCTDTTITTCFTSTPPPLSINNTVQITNKICASFTGSIIGQLNLTSPSYCLLDSTNVIIRCNTNGIFNNLPYGKYCIKVTDGCRDTTIITCFSAIKPIPFIPAIITPNYTSCTKFGIIVGGNNLTAPQYCLYNNLNVVIACNTTGIFDNLPSGSYCATVHDSCFDTTITRCFTAGPPPIINDIITAITNKTCSTFTVSASSVNIKNAWYCLYSASDSLINCDSSGVFNSLPYGAYCLKVKNDCPDTSFTKCFTGQPNYPSVNNTVNFTNTTCATFSAKITGQTNLTNPNYCLYDSVGGQIICNTSGQFDNLAYGKYCIKIVNTCYDTTILRCFTALPKAVKIAVSTAPSCSYNFAKFSINVSSGALPFNVKIYTASGSLFFNNNYTTNNITIDNIPGTVAGQQYKIFVADNCGTKDSATLNAVKSYVDHTASPSGKCPSGTFVNGSGDINSTAATNMGSLTVRVINKDNTALSPQLSPNTVSGGVYTFQDLGPGTYILSYKANDPCNIYLFDTVVVSPYSYPTLGRSSGYQCDVNGFSMGAVVSNGVGPFAYEIIGSSPSTPSIVAPPQSSPIFFINNGTNYSLVRLRAVDGCGNGTLNDASILPLANNGIVNTYNCFQIATTLSIDTVYGSTYSWYKKATNSSTDSVYLGSSESYYIPKVLPSDTGIYVCNLIVNGGCITRSYTYHLDGSCNHPLPITLQDFKGKFITNTVLLNWKTALLPNVKTFIVERNNGNNDFAEIGRVKCDYTVSAGLYSLLDPEPKNKNYYRLKFIYLDGTFSYSNTVALHKNVSFGHVQVYPNPVHDVLNIDFKGIYGHGYKITLLSTLSQVVKEIKFTSTYSNYLQIIRTKNTSSGMYILKIIDMVTNEETSQRIIFR